MAEIAKKEIQAITPVKTGRLKKSIRVSILGNKATIDSTEDYAVDVEYGHMQNERFVPVLEKMLLRMAKISKRLPFMIKWSL